MYICIAVPLDLARFIYLGINRAPHPRLAIALKGSAGAGHDQLGHAGYLGTPYVLYRSQKVTGSENYARKSMIYPQCT